MWKRGFRETALIIKRNANLNLDRTFVSKVTVNPAFRWGKKRKTKTVGLLTAEKKERSTYR